MALRAPNLDDRTFQQLLDQARLIVQRRSPEWNDLTPGDPGVVLLELFSYLTETMIYRLNRLPEKAYIEFLRLIGLRLQPPSPARAELLFTRSRPGDNEIVIPRGTRATVTRTAGGGESPVFVTIDDEVIAPGGTSVTVSAYNCELVDAELVGRGTGLAGQTYVVRRPPISAPVAGDTDLVVGVEAEPTELGESTAAREHEGKAFRIWREVSSFALAPEPYVYVIDRLAGTITFAPAARLIEGEELEEIPTTLASVPGAGREIRVWYRSGGGSQGNVSANTLTTLRDQIANVEVNNPAPATGGRAQESLANALVRGPHEFHTLQRAVTARDFELFATSSGAISRANAFTRRDLWAHALPGAVEVLLVPELGEADRAGQVTAAKVESFQTEATRAELQRTLDERRPLGTSCVVSWARYKTVRVKARIVVHREENVAAVRQRVIQRLHEAITPLVTPLNPGGWPFGEDLQASHVYEIAVSEPGVRYADQVSLLVDEVPGRTVTMITADVYQPNTFHAASGSTVFRSLNSGLGWEPARKFEGEDIIAVRVHPDIAGIIAVATRIQGSEECRLHVSYDCGETWRAGSQLAFPVEDVAWSVQDDGSPLLFLATDVGLYRLDVSDRGGPVQVLVDPAKQALGFYGATAVTIRGTPCLALVAQNLGGVFLSTEGGKERTFRHIGLKGEDIRTLAVQHVGNRVFLWAGAAAEGGADKGKGCFSWELTRPNEAPAEGWVARSRGWDGGSCNSITFRNTEVLAATHHSGVLRLDSSRTDSEWAVPGVRSGLPLRDRENFLFLPVATVAAGPSGGIVLAGTEEGVLRSLDGERYEPSSLSEFRDRVTLADTWLFCSGDHDIQVVTEDEIR